jgi:putative nucleotidyltransferase with HDIG domain
MPEEPIRRKRVLFVDDEPLVLQGLQRVLRGMRNEWEMEFVDGGQKALEAMRESLFDVVVTDMQMPGMDGAQLLNALAREFPDTIRIILSGHADQNLIIQCLDSAHQYLTKPCDPDLLKRLVNEACRLEGKVASERVRKVVGSIERLPSIPATYQKLSEALEREETTTAELGRIIASDIGMTAKILKLVNSAFFGLRRELTNPTDAVTYLGTETVRSLVLVTGIFEEAKPLATRRIRLEDIWAHSLSVAQNARAILRAFHAGEQDQNSAFTSGLLHDAGTLILARHFPEAYDDALDLVANQHYLMSLAEQRFLGVNHAEVGAYLIGLWGLSPVIVQSIQFHHNPSEVPNVLDGMSPLAALHLADGFYAKISLHPAFEYSVLDPALLAAPWLVERLDGLQRTFSQS